MRQRPLFATARRSATSTPKRWAATSVAVNDDWREVAALDTQVTMATEPHLLHRCRSKNSTILA
jgi:hypothetical protein